MKTFLGRIRSRLPDNGGEMCFAFEHTSGAILKLRMKPQKPLPLDNQAIVAIGELIGPGIISAQEVRDAQPGDTFNL
jgi:hypothetical protein